MSNDISHLLPLDAVDRGWTLTWSKPYSAYQSTLWDRNRNVLYKWDYIPSLTEIFEVCKELLNGV